MPAGCSSWANNQFFIIFSSSSFDVKAMAKILKKK